MTTTAAATVGRPRRPERSSRRREQKSELAAGEGDGDRERCACVRRLGGERRGAKKETTAAARGIGQLPPQRAASRIRRWPTRSPFPQLDENLAVLRYVRAYRTASRFKNNESEKILVQIETGKEKANFVRPDSFVVFVVSIANAHTHTEHSSRRFYRFSFPFVRPFSCPFRSVSYFLAVRASFRSVAARVRGRRYGVASSAPTPAPARGAAAGRPLGSGGVGSLGATTTRRDAPQLDGAAFCCRGGM